VNEEDREKALREDEITKLGVEGETR